LKVDRDTYVEVTKEELENIALESTRTIDINEFVAKDEIDPRYIIRPYYLVPDGKVGHDAFAVIRETIRNMDMVAIGRVVLTSREHIIGLEPLGKGLMGMLLRYPYEVRNGTSTSMISKTWQEMLHLARHIVNQKTADFEPEKFEDHYEQALKELVGAKLSGKTIGPTPRPRADNVVNLMDALRQRIASDASKKPRKAAAGQKENRRERRFRKESHKVRACTWSSEGWLKPLSTTPSFAIDRSRSPLGGGSRITHSVANRYR
jgi:DNA end-binding protein Ku